jgi:hypothetical protein
VNLIGSTWQSNDRDRRSHRIGETIPLALSQAEAAVALTSHKLENVVPVAEKILATGSQALALQAHAGVGANAETVVQ